MVPGDPTRKVSVSLRESTLARIDATAIADSRSRTLDALVNEALDRRNAIRTDGSATSDSEPAGRRSQASEQPKPWRDVIRPRAETIRPRADGFAADLRAVHDGHAPPYYDNPEQFYQRTYLTEGLRLLLASAVQRLATGSGGESVFQIRGSFGVGKTHWLLALYHLFSGATADRLPGIDAVWEESGGVTLPQVKRVVLAGDRISPGNPVTKPDGTIVRTMWGELAWQLGGKEAYERIRLDDERATNPGDTLRVLLDENGPCLVLIDEWIAYATQLQRERDLPAGDFDTQISFAQTLCESVQAADRCFLAVSFLDAEHPSLEAPPRLRTTISHFGTVLSVATGEYEGFEIVRRQLFEPMCEPSRFEDRDVAIRAFVDFYRTRKRDFPPESATPQFEIRLKAAYPFHPEIFARLYTDWSRLTVFQSTRSVLRLTSAVIHSLWRKGDCSPLILPSGIPADDLRVTNELTSHLPEFWHQAISAEVDGQHSLPFRVDCEVPELREFAVAQRVARAIFFCTAPTATTTGTRPGLGRRLINLGCVMPGESFRPFARALRRLTEEGMFLRRDSNRFWYSPAESLTRKSAER